MAAQVEHSFESIPSIEQIRMQAEGLLNSYRQVQKSKNNVEVITFRQNVEKLKAFVSKAIQGIEVGQDSLVKEIKVGLQAFGIDEEGIEGHIYRIAEDADFQAEEPGGFPQDMKQPDLIEDSWLQGLFMYFVLDGVGHEFFIFGNNEKPDSWNKKSPGKRQLFVKRHTERMLSGGSNGLYDELPADYFFVVRDLGNSYRIDNVISYHKS